MIDSCVGHMKIWKPWIPSMHENVNNSVHRTHGIGIVRKGAQHVCKAVGIKGMVIGCTGWSGLFCMT